MKSMEVFDIELDNDQRNRLMNDLWGWELFEGIVYDEEGNAIGNTQLKTVKDFIKHERGLAYLEGLNDARKQMRKSLGL